MAEERTRREADLVRRCADGEATAWETFVDRYGGLLTGLARRMLHRRTGRASDEDVDEIVAEVFLALLRRDRLLLRRYDPSWRLSTYLGVVCRTAVGRHLRRRRTPLLDEAERVLEEPAGQEGLDALTADEREDALRRLREGMASLAPRERLLLTLRFLEGLDYRAIAEALDVSPESVGSLLKRAKRKLASRVASLEGLLADDG